MKKNRILIVDDDASILMVLQGLLEDKGLDVVTATDGKSGAKLLSERANDAPFDIAFLDINMPKKDGLTVLTEMREGGCGTSIIIMTAESTMENTLEAMRRGAFDYITKPFDLDEVEILVERALENTLLKSELTALKERLRERVESETAFIGRSRKIQSVFKTVGRIADQDVTALILGESGTGKELLAKLIYSNSPRSEAPFIAVNTAAIPADLMESELFGYEKGAFTGASERRKGKFELADGGTLFLDEIGDMSLDLQASLLRAIQEREFYRVGGRDPVRVNVRIIAATNRDLDTEVTEKRFREDLYFRLNVIKIVLPPLRERKGDIQLLADYFLHSFSGEMGIAEKCLSKGALKELEGYHWPGNVRELENVLRRAVLLTSTEVLTPGDLMLPKDGVREKNLSDIITDKISGFIDKTPSEGDQELYDTFMPIMEKPLISLVLKKAACNQVHAAKLLGINRNTLRKKIKELSIDLKALSDD